MSPYKVYNLEQNDIQYEQPARDTKWPAMALGEAHCPLGLLRPCPAHTQPGHHVADGSEELCFLFLRVGVIKAQKADPIVGLGELQYL